MRQPDKVKILIVDDLPEKILVLQTILADLGEDVIVARSGAEALGQVLHHDFAVILLDINMPDMDGYETAELIRRRKRSAHVPMIFVTSFHDQVHEARGYSLGAVDYILSPVVPDILRTKVKVFADLFRMTVEAKRHAEERLALVREQAAREEAERHAAALRASEERFRLASEAVTGFIYEVDLTTQMGSASPGITELLGFQVEEANNLEWWESRLHPEDRAAAMQTIAEAQQKRSRHYRLEYRIRHLNGHYLHVWDQGVIVSDRSGQPVRRVGNVVDITERKRAEQSVADANRRKDEFLSMLAHELRNPLAPIRNAVHIMRQIKPTDSRLCAARDMIDRNVTQLTRLVDDLLDVSRITQGKIRLERSPLSLEVVLAQAVEICTPLIEARGHRLNRQTPLNSVMIEGDVTRLTQIFANLITNAAKYSEDKSEIWLTVKPQDTEVVIEIRDNGIGLSSEMLEAVFEPFTQVAAAIDRSHGGLGIGLTLVRRLVQMHGGRVTAASEGPGTGCTFTVHLPRLQQAETVPGERRMPSTTTFTETETRRVLVVDDNVDAAQSLGFLVGLSGHDVRIVHSSSDALMESESFRPQVVILDIGLPQMDGYEVARLLRRDPQSKDATLVALTGYGQAEDRRKASEAGFDHHFVKPVDLEKLQQILRNAGQGLPSDLASTHA